MFDPENLEVTLPSHGQIVTIQNIKGDVLVGILVENSIAIPLSATDETDYNLKVITQANLVSIGNTKESFPEAACHMMGLPFNGQTGGIYSDGNAIGQINAVHIHSNGVFNVQEDFLKRTKAAFHTKGLTVSVLESL